MHLFLILVTYIATFEQIKNFVTRRLNKFEPPLHNIPYVFL